MSFKCHKCPDCFLCARDLERHLARKIPCDQGNSYCLGCDGRFSCQKAVNLHIRLGRCKGKSDSQKVTELGEIVKDKDKEIEQLTKASSDFATMKEDYDAAMKENTLLLKENKQLTTENANLLETRSQLRLQVQEFSLGRSHIRQIFKFEVADMHLRGNYIVETFGISLDVPVDIRCIITKQGRAVEQSIADRSHDTLRKHPDNRIMCIKHCKDPGEAERNFKRMARGLKMLKSGTFPDGSRGTEFVVFLPEEAEQVFSMFTFATSSSSKDEELEELRMRLRIVERKEKKRKRREISGSDSES